ncbi:hypothetical protein GCM10029964_031830 [Kibdelosporangium lantanae]
MGVGGGRVEPGRWRLDPFPLAEPEDRDVESSLRPKRLSEFVGQARVREQLTLVLEGAMRRGSPPDHVLLSGPPGLGKTSLSMIIAAELGSAIRITSGPALERAGDLAAMLSNLVEGDVLFIDEIHRMARPAEEMLYLAMEDFRVDVVVGKGPGATSIPLDIAPFTLVGATTRSGVLTGPLRDRFGFTAHMEFYEPHELEQVVTRSAAILGVDLRPDGAVEIAGRSRGTPRIANRLLRRVRDYAEVRANGAVTRKSPRPRSPSTTSTNSASTALTGPFSPPWCGRSAADLSVFRLWPWRWAKSRLPWRRCVSRTWYELACWQGHLVAGSPPRPRGLTWGCKPRATRQARRRLPCSASDRADGGAGPVRRGAGTLGGRQPE